MPPRFLERMQRQSDVLRDVFGDPQNDPPPYPFSPGRTNSSASSFQYRLSADLASYQSRLSQDSTPTSSVTGHHRRQASNQSTSSLRMERRSTEYANYHSAPPPGYAQATTPVRESFDISAIPRDALILVTAANSFQGLHIVDQLLQRGFRVRGTVRNAEKAVWTAKFFLNRYGAGRYTTAVIPDMAAQHAFDIAVRGCSGVIHVASVTTPSSDPSEVITPSIAGAVNVLEAASKEPAIRHVVLTSCMSAAMDRERRTRSVLGAESWNMADFERAWTPPSHHEGGEVDDRAAAVAASSKMQTEQAAWRWYWERRPSFVLNTVLPGTLWGAPLTPAPFQKQTPPSIVALAALFTPTETPSEKKGHFTHPADAAALHLAALLLPDIQHERLFAVGGSWTQQAVLDSALQKRSPDWARVSWSGETGRLSVLSENSDMSSYWATRPGAEKAENLLRRMGRPGWRDLDGSLREAIQSFRLEL